MFQKTWYQLGRSIVNVYVRHVLRANIVHEAPLPKGAKILAVNHPSTSDPAFVTVLVKEQTSILIRESLFKVPVFGRSLRMAGHVPVLAGNGRAALEEGIRLLKAGRTVVVFPEGEISPESGPLKPHTGIARLALATGAPVIPVGISLDHRQVRVVQTRVEGRLEPSAWYLHGPYAMTVGTPIVYEGDAEDRDYVRSVTGQVMSHIVALSQKGQSRLAIAQRQAALRAANASMMARAARWTAQSVILRGIQAMLFFLIGTAGRV
jgi:1-acyl-sn-glycerol-3-phosphate acyltransferase